MRDWQPFLGLPLWFWLFVIPTLFALICLFYPSKAKRLMHRIWPLMDRVYLAFGILSAIFMVIILLLIVGQMVARGQIRSFQEERNLPVMRWHVHLFLLWHLL